MMEDWSLQWCDIFLEELYRHYRSPEQDHCLCGSPTGKRFHCDDCVTNLRFCSKCLLSCHSTAPTHRISVWNGYTWSRTTLAAQSLVVNLGQHIGACSRTSPKELLLGDITGFHEVKVTYCACQEGQNRCIQLLRAAIMPCSTDKPDSGFTFRCLRMYDLLSTDAKLSGSRFHSILQRQTNNITPHQHRSRLRELLRVARQFMFLQVLKRSGQVNRRSAGLGDLALWCPACPLIDVNYIHNDVMEGLECVLPIDLSYARPK
jgi:hypothetical protein